MDQHPNAGAFRGLHGLRAIACLAVFLENFHHSMGMAVSGRLGPANAAYLAESGLGVIILIVLSGALLSQPFWRHIVFDEPPVSWRSYVVRRFVRLAPAYYMCLVVLLLVTRSSVDPLDVAAHALFVNNLWEASFYSLSPQFWAIGIFMQFALLTPILFFGLRRLTPRGTSPVAVVVAFAVFAYVLHWLLMATRDAWVGWPVSVLASRDGYVISHSTLAHLPQFLFGVIGGYVLARLRRRSTEPVGWFAYETQFWIAFVGMMAFATIPSLAPLEFPYGRYLFPWMGGFIVLAIVTLPFARFSRTLFDLAPIRGLGVISYGVYIYHMACLTAVQRVLKSSGIDPAAHKLGFAAMGLALTVVVATLSYLVVERPLLRKTQSRASTAA